MIAILTKLGSVLISRTMMKAAMTAFFTGPIVSNWTTFKGIILSTNPSYSAGMWKVLFPTIINQYIFSFVLATYVSFSNTWVGFTSWILRREFTPIKVEEIDYDNILPTPRLLGSLLTSLVRIKNINDEKLQELLTKAHELEQTQNQLLEAKETVEKMHLAVLEKAATLEQKEHLLNQREESLIADSEHIDRQYLELNFVKETVMQSRDYVSKTENLEEKIDQQEKTINNLLVENLQAKSEFSSYLNTLKNKICSVFSPFVSQIKEKGYIEIPLSFSEFKNSIKIFFEAKGVPLDPFLESLGFDDSLVGKVVIVALEKNETVKLNLEVLNENDVKVSFSLLDYPDKLEVQLNSDDDVTIVSDGVINVNVNSKHKN